MNVRNRTLIIVGLIAAIIVAVGLTTAVRGQKGTNAVTSSVTTTESVTSPDGVTASRSATTSSKR